MVISCNRQFIAKAKIFCLFKPWVAVIRFRNYSNKAKWSFCKTPHYILSLDSSRTISRGVVWVLGVQKLLRWTIFASNLRDIRVQQDIDPCLASTNRRRCTRVQGVPASSAVVRLPKTTLNNGVGKNKQWTQTNYHSIASSTREHFKQELVQIEEEFPVKLWLQEGRSEL